MLLSWHWGLQREPVFVFTPRIKVISISLLSQDAVVILGRNKLSHLTTERCDFRNVDTSENYTNLDPIDFVVFYSTQMLLVFFKLKFSQIIHYTKQVMSLGRKIEKDVFWSCMSLNVHWSEGFCDVDSAEGNLDILRVLLILFFIWFIVF